MRKKKILGIKVKQRHSKADVKAFDKLGSEMRASTRKAGFLMKRGGNHQNWKRRWCVLSALGLGYVAVCAQWSRLWHQMHVPLSFRHGCAWRCPGTSWMSTGTPPRVRCWHTR